MAEDKKIKFPDLEDLERLRDEIQVQAHLFKKETQAEWDALEEKWKELNRSLNPVKSAAGESLEDIGAASKLLLDTVKEGYKKIKKSLT